MPWLEVPEWRAWESYARLMSDTPDTNPDVEVEDTSVVITGELHIVADDDNDTIGAPSIDDVLAGNVPGEDDGQADADTDLQAAIDEHPAGRFPVENEAEREDGPAAARYETPPTADHLPLTAGESDEDRARRIEKESMSRRERIRRGW